jgi:hypothetical protein
MKNVTREEVIAALNKMFDDAEANGSPVKGLVFFGSNELGTGQYAMGTISSQTLQTMSEFTEDCLFKIMSFHSAFPNKPSDN